MDGGQPDTDTGGPAGPPSLLRSTVEWLAVVLGALFVALLIKTFLFQAFFIPSDSMTPTLMVGDRVLVNKLSYDLHDVNRGDLVVFKRPAGTPGDVDDLIKRVIALPGEEVTLDGGTITIDGKALVEPYLPEEVTTCCIETLIVPEDHIFVMGDNRGESFDSRRFGPIPVKSIVGRAFIRVWPPSRVGTL